MVYGVLECGDSSPLFFFPTNWLVSLSRSQAYRAELSPHPPNSKAAMNCRTPKNCKRRQVVAILSLALRVGVSPWTVTGRSPAHLCQFAEVVDCFVEVGGFDAALAAGGVAFGQQS